MAFAFTTTHDAGHGIRGALHAALDRVHAFLRKAAERRAYRATRRALAQLPDSTLADLGLTRDEIDRAALEAAIGSVHERGRA